MRNAMNRYRPNPKAIARVGALLLILCPAISQSLRADIVVFQDGKRLEGVVTSAPGDSDSIVFQQIAGPVRIPRSRIKSIELQDEATDLVIVGNLLYSAEKYDKALETYQKAEALKPGDSRIVERIARTRTAITRQADLLHKEEIGRIDGRLDEALLAIEAQNFKEAEKILDDLASLQPEGEQKERILEIRKQLYKDWGDERLDKLDEITAARHYEKYLELDPSNKIVFESLIVIWDEMPEKCQAVIAAYETHLKMKPKDHETRKKLADKYLEYAKLVWVSEADKKDTPEEQKKGQLESRAYYEKAAQELIALYDSGEFKRSDLEKSLIDTMEILYTDARREKDFSKAVTAYKNLQKYDKTAAEEELYKLEFWRDASKLDPSDADGRTKLALKLRSQGLDSMARLELDRLKLIFPENQNVRNAVHLYAMELKTEMLKAWQTLRFEDASRLATQCLIDYGDYPDIEEDARKIRALADVEITKENRVGNTARVKYEEQGDKYYSQGLYYREAMRNNEVNQSSRVVIDKNEAIRNFGLAVNFYQKALENKQGMNAATLETVTESLNSASYNYKQLTTNQAVPGYRSRTSRPR